MWNFLKGKKTYLVALATCVYAVSGAASGAFNWQHAVELLFGAGGISALRNGIS